MKGLMMIALMLGLSACMPTEHSVLQDKNHDTVEQAMQAPRQDNLQTGSLWKNTGATMFTDPKAAHVGDLVTVLVQENASATRQLDMSKSKASSRQTAVNAFLGYEKSLAAKNTNFTPSSAVNMSDSNSFNGQGATSNSDTLTASVTAVVTEVFPNGNLRIAGRREVTINQQPQELTFAGVIRPSDIAPDNTIPSAKVAQAKISYGGGGELASVAHQGWFGRTLDMIWPF